MPLIQILISLAILEGMIIVALIMALNFALTHVWEWAKDDAIENIKRWNNQRIADQAVEATQEAAQ